MTDWQAAKRIKLEIRIPLSATEAYLRMLRYLYESAQLFGGPLVGGAKFVIAVSADMPERDLYSENSWTRAANLDFRWCNPRLFERWGYHATILERMQIPPESDVVLLCDADMFFAGDFDEVVEAAYTEEKIFGMIAPWSPFRADKNCRDKPSRYWWERIFAAAGLECPPLDHQHPGWGHGYSDEIHRFCPCYFNGGFITARAQDISKLGSSFEMDLANIASVRDGSFKSQVATTLGIVRHGLGCGTLDWRYNCPPGFPPERFAELGSLGKPIGGPHDVKVFHYLAKAEINKSDFATQAALDAALDRDDLSITTKVFCEKVSLVRDRINMRG